MKIGGLLFVRVPDYGSFWSKLLGERWIWFQPRNHYFHYTKASLTHLLESVGFRVLLIRSQRPNNWITHCSFYVASATLKKYRRWVPSFRKRLGRFYEHLVGIEIYSVAVNK